MRVLDPPQPQPQPRVQARRRDGAGRPAAREETLAHPTRRHGPQHPAYRPACGEPLRRNSFLSLAAASRRAEQTTRRFSAARPGEARSLARSRTPNRPRGQLTGATTTTASPPCLKKTVSSHAHTHIHARRHATRHSVLNSHARTLRSRRAVYPPHRAARAVLRSSTRGPSLVSEDCHEEPSGGRNNHVTLRRHSRLRKPATPRAHPSRGPRGPLNPPHTHPGKQACDDTPTEPDVPPHPSLGAGEG